MVQVFMICIVGILTTKTTNAVKCIEKEATPKRIHILSTLVSWTYKLLACVETKLILQATGFSIFSTKHMNLF